MKAFFLAMILGGLCLAALLDMAGWSTYSVVAGLGVGLCFAVAGMVVADTVRPTF